ncbi:MAG: cellulase family glycosylhydrolase, partial [Tepidisphaeraceae bacterium]
MKHLIVFLTLLTLPALAELPPAPANMLEWPLPWNDTTPGLMSADSLIPKPAGKDGFVVARDGHFYSGQTRVRFWGVNIAFAGCFPKHDDADAVAKRLAHFGFNAVRLHHMDMQPYPNGIFADGKLETLSPEALEHLDYFISALKREGIYSNINLHVSRWYSKAHNWPGADKTQSFDKIVDIFYPELIDVQKTYAHDLLGHVNAYTKLRYA